jgi:hypothetical protein
MIYSILWLFLMLLGCCYDVVVVKCLPRRARVFATLGPLEITHVTVTPLWKGTSGTTTRTRPLYCFIRPLS